LRNELNRLEFELAVFTLDILPRGDCIGDISLFLFRLIAASLYPLLSDKCLGALSYCNASVNTKAVGLPLSI